MPLAPPVCEERTRQRCWVTFDEALAALLALVGEPVDIHVFDASSIPHLIATFGGRLRAGYSMSGGDPAPNEAISTSASSAAAGRRLLSTVKRQQRQIRRQGKAIRALRAQSG